MFVTLRELAELVGGRLVGDAGLLISGAATIRDARPGEITLADRAKLAPQLAQSAASAVIVSEKFTPDGLPHICVPDVHAAFALVVQRFRPQRKPQAAGVSPHAIVAPTARLAPDVVVHPGAYVADDVEVGPRSVIHSGARVLPGCKLGADVVIFPNVVLYEETIIGDRCLIHAGAVLGAYGFGYETVAGRHRLSAQLGYVELGSDVEVGAGSTIDRGTYGPTTIGEGTKIDNQVMIAHNCRIGRHNIICSQVGVAGSGMTGDYVVLAGQVGIRDHISVGDRAIVGAQAGVMCDVPPSAHFLGSPAMPERDEMRMLAAQAKLPEMRKQLKQLQRLVEELTGQTLPGAEQDAA